MRFIYLRFILMIFLSVGLLCFPTFAEEEKTEEATEGAPPVSGETSRDYTDKISKINTLESRIHEGGELFKSLVRAKDSEVDETKKKEIIKQMLEVHEERSKNIRDYSKLRKVLRYKFPNKGKTIEHRYAPMKEKSVEELEQEATIDDVLDHAKQVVDKKFKAINEEAERRKAEAVIKGQASSKDQRRVPKPKKSQETQQLRLIK